MHKLVVSRITTWITLQSNPDGKISTPVTYWNFPVEEKKHHKIKDTIIHASNKWIDTYDLNIYSDSDNST